MTEPDPGINFVYTMTLYTSVPSVTIYSSKLGMGALIPTQLVLQQLGGYGSCLAQVMARHGGQAAQSLELGPSERFRRSGRGKKIISEWISERVVGHVQEELE
jgi:hypothetical protein